MAEHICVKVSNLRKLGYFSIREWVDDKPDNMYVGRCGRVWITEDEYCIDEHGKQTKVKTMFHYKTSRWCNPYKVNKNNSLENSLDMFEKHLYSSGLLADIGELKGKKLGCFCDPHAKCHGKILAKIVNSL
jgi:hypothetical protein